jgi:hypothetical protein
MNTRIFRFTAWMAIFSSFASIIALVSLLLFFSLETSTNASQNPHFWGPISDIAPIFQMLSLLIVALVFYFIQQTLGLRLNVLICLVGTVGMADVVILQVLLRFNILSFEEEVTPVLFATGLVGIWLVMISLACRRKIMFPMRLAWLGVAVGAAFILEPVIFILLDGAANWRVFMSNYLLLTISAGVFLTSYIGFPIWAFCLGRFFLKMDEPLPNSAEISNYI